MARLTLDQVDQMKTTREVDRQIFRGYDVKMGDADKFKRLVDRFRINNGMKPEYGSINGAI